MSERRPTKLSRNNSRWQTLTNSFHEALAQYETYAKIVARNERAVLARMIGDATHRRLRQEYVHRLFACALGLSPVLRTEVRVSSWRHVRMEHDEAVKTIRNAHTKWLDEQVVQSLGQIGRLRGGRSVILSTRHRSFNARAPMPILSGLKT